MEYRVLDRLPAPDFNDMKFLMRAITPPVPTVLDDRYWNFPGSLDQGREGACVGYMWTHWAMCGPIVNRNVLDPRAVYREAQTIDEWPGEAYEGTSVRAGAKVLQRLKLIESYHWARNTDEIFNYLLTTGPVGLGTDWMTEMWEPTKEGIVRARGRVSGGHAYLIIGGSKKRGMFRCVNSWGQRWGQKGRFWLPAEDLEFLLAQGGEAVAAVELKHAA